MATLVWDQTTDRRYASGVSRGVFYPLGGAGLVWDGLLEVEESEVDGVLSTYYLDGIRYLAVAEPGDYQAKVTALFAPAEFAPYEGLRSPIPGFFLTRQPKQRFNFSYRTEMGEDYKIHLLYNVLATPTTMAWETIGEVITTSSFEWEFDATPVIIPGFRPSAHFVIDSSSTPPEVLSDFEDLLYGTDVAPAAFPTTEQLLELFA